MLRNTFSNIKRVCVLTGLPRVWRGHIMKTSQMKFQRLPCALFSSGKNKPTENERDRCDRILKYLFGEDENEEIRKRLKQDIRKERSKLLSYKPKSTDQDVHEDLFDRKIDAILKATSTIIKEEKRALEKAKLLKQVNPNMHIQTSGKQDVVSEKKERTIRLTTSRKQGSEELEQKIEKIRDPSFVDAGKTGEDLADITPSVLNNKIFGEKADTKHSDFHPITQIGSLSKIMMSPMKVFNVDKFSSKKVKAFRNAISKAERNLKDHSLSQKQLKPIKMQPCSQNAKGNTSLNPGTTNVSAFDSTRIVFDKSEEAKKQDQEKSHKTSKAISKSANDLSDKKLISKAKEANPYSLVNENNKDSSLSKRSPILIATKPEATGPTQLHESAKEKSPNAFILTNKQTRETPKIEEAKSTTPWKDIDHNPIVNLTTQSNTKATKANPPELVKKIEQDPFVSTSKPIKVDMESNFPKEILAREKYQDPFGFRNKPVEQVVKPKGTKANLNKPVQKTNQETVSLTKNTKGNPFTIENLSAYDKEQDPFSSYTQIKPEFHRAIKQSANTFILSKKLDLPGNENKKDQQKLDQAKLKAPTLGTHIDAKSHSIENATSKQFVDNLNMKSEFEDAKTKDILSVHFDSNAVMARETSANIKAENSQSNDLTKTASFKEKMATSESNIATTTTRKMSQIKAKQSSGKLDALNESSHQYAQSNEKSSLSSKSDKTDDILKENQNLTCANSTDTKAYLNRYLAQPEQAEYSGQEPNHLGLIQNQDLPTENDYFFPNFENDISNHLPPQNFQCQPMPPENKESHVMAPVVGFIDVPAELCQPTPCPTNTYMQPSVKPPDSQTSWIGAIVPLCPKQSTVVSSAQKTVTSVQGISSGKNSEDTENSLDNEMNESSQTYTSMKQLPQTPMNMNQPYMRTCQSPQMYISLSQLQRQNMLTNVPNQMLTGIYQQPQWHTEMYQQPPMYTGMHYQPQMYTEMYQQPQMYAGMYQPPEMYMEMYQQPQMYTEMYQQPQMYTEMYQQPQMYTEMYQQPQMCTTMYQQPQMCTTMYQQPHMYTGMKQSPEEKIHRSEWGTSGETPDVSSFKKKDPRLDIPMSATTGKLSEINEGVTQLASTSKQETSYQEMRKPATSAELLALRASLPFDTKYSASSSPPSKGFTNNSQNLQNYFNNPMQSNPASSATYQEFSRKMSKPSTRAELLALRASLPFDNNYSNSYSSPSRGYTNNSQNYQQYSNYPMQSPYYYNQSNQMSNFNANTSQWSNQEQANAQKIAFNVSKLTNDFYNWLFKRGKGKQDDATPDFSQYLQHPGYSKPSMNWPPQAQWDNSTYYQQRIQEKLPPKYIQTLPINLQKQLKLKKPLSKELPATYIPPSSSSQVLPEVHEKISQTQMKSEMPQNQEQSNMNREFKKQIKLPVSKIAPKYNLIYSKRIRQAGSQAFCKNLPRSSSTRARYFSTDRSHLKKSSSSLPVKTDSKQTVSNRAKVEINDIFPVSKYLISSDEQIFHTNQKHIGSRKIFALRKTFKIPLVFVSKIQNPIFTTVQDALTAALTLPPTEITNSNSENKTKQENKEVVLSSTHQKLKTHIPATVGPLPILHDKKNLPLSALLSNNVDFTTPFAEHETSDPQEQYEVETKCRKCNKCGKCSKCKPPPPPPRCPPQCPPPPCCPLKGPPPCLPCPPKKLSSGPFKGNSCSESSNKKSAEARRKRILSYIFGESDFPLEELRPLRQELRISKFSKKPKKYANTDPYKPQGYTRALDVINDTNKVGKPMQVPQVEILTAEETPRLIISDTHLFHDDLVNSYYEQKIRSEADLVLAHSARESSTYPSAEQLLGMAISISNSGKGSNEDKKDQGKYSCNLKMESKLKSQEPTKQVQSIDENSQLLKQKIEDMKGLLDLKNLEITRLNLKLASTSHKELEDSRKELKSLKEELLNRSNAIKALSEQNKEMLQLKSKLERQKAEPMKMETLRQKYQQKFETVVASKNNEIKSLKNELSKLYKTQSCSAIDKLKLEENYKELEEFLLKVKRNFEMLLTTIKNEKQPLAQQTTPNKMSSPVASTPNVMKQVNENQEQQPQQLSNFAMPQYLADIKQDTGGSLHIYLKQFDALADKHFNRILELHKNWYNDNIGNYQVTENTVSPYWDNSNTRNWSNWTEPGGQQMANQNVAYNTVKEGTFPLQICPNTHPNWPTYCQCHFNSENAGQNFTLEQQQQLPEATGKYFTRTHPDWCTLCQTHLHNDNFAKPLTPTQQQQQEVSEKTINSRSVGKRFFYNVSTPKELKAIQFTLQNLDDQGRIKPLTPKTCNKSRIENCYKRMSQKLENKDCYSCKLSEPKNEMSLESSNPNQFKPQVHLQYRENCANPNMTNNYENQPSEDNGLNKVVTSNQTGNEIYYLPHKNEVQLQFKDSPRRTEPPLPSDSKTQPQGMLRPIHSASQHVDSKCAVSQYQMLTYENPFSNKFSSQHFDDKGHIDLQTPGRANKRDLSSDSCKNNLSSDYLIANSNETTTQREQGEKKCLRYQNPSQLLNYQSHDCSKLPNHDIFLSNERVLHKDQVENELDSKTTSLTPKTKPFYMKYNRLENSKQQNDENEITSKNSVKQTVKTQEIYLHNLPSDDIKQTPTHNSQLETTTFDNEITSFAKTPAVKPEPKRVIFSDHLVNIGKPPPIMLHDTINVPVKKIPSVDARTVLKALYSDIHDPFRTAALKVAKEFKKILPTKSEKLQVHPQILVKPEENVDVQLEVFDPVKLTEQLCGIRINISQEAEPNKNLKNHVLKPVRLDETAVNLPLLKKLNEKVEGKDVSENTLKAKRQTEIITSEEPNVKEDRKIELSKVKPKEIKQKSPILTSKLQKPELNTNNNTAITPSKVKQEQIEGKSLVSTVPSKEIKQASKENSVSSTTSEQRTEREPSILTRSFPVPDHHEVDDFAITPSRVKHEQIGESHIPNTVNKTEMTTTKSENPIMPPQTPNVNSVGHIPSKVNKEQTGDNFILPVILQKVEHNSSLSEIPQPPKFEKHEKHRQEITVSEAPVSPVTPQAENFNKHNNSLITPSKTEQEQFKQSPTSNVTDNTKITNLNTDETVNAKSNMTPTKPVNHTVGGKNDVPFSVLLQRKETKKFKDRKEADSDLSINENNIDNTYQIIQKMKTKLDPTKDAKRLDNLVVNMEQKQTGKSQNKELPNNLPLSVILQRLREKNRKENYKQFFNSLDKSCVLAKTSPLSNSGSPDSPPIPQTPDQPFTKCPLPESPDSSQR